MQITETRYSVVPSLIFPSGRVSDTHELISIPHGLRLCGLRSKDSETPS